jgi:hypothetical protein
MTGDRFAIVPLPDGCSTPADAIAVGPMSLVTEYLPQSVARANREREADNLALRSLKIAADTALRADAVIEREHQVRAQADAAQAIMSDAINRFADDVLKLSHRFDEFEQRKIADALRELPDPDGVAPDDGDLEVKGAKSETETETVLGDDQNPGDLPNELETNAPPPLGNYPTYGRESPQQPQPVDISLNAADDAMPVVVAIAVHGNGNRGIDEHDNAEPG